MYTYETILITRATLTEEDESALVDAFAGLIGEGGGTLVHRDRMGKRRLAYPIRKEDDGVYTRFLFDAEPAVSTELERRAKLQDKILRFMTVRLERDWARDAKAQAVRDQEAARQAAEEAANAPAEDAPAEDASDEGAAGEPVEAKPDAPPEKADSKPETASTGEA